MKAPGESNQHIVNQLAIFHAGGDHSKFMFFVSSFVLMAVFASDAPWSWQLSSPFCLPCKVANYVTPPHIIFQFGPLAFLSSDWSSKWIEGRIMIYEIAAAGLVSSLIGSLLSLNACVRHNLCGDTFMDMMSIFFTGLLLGLHVMSIAALSRSKKAALELHRRGVIV